MSLTETRFWEIVAEINWAGICASERRIRSDVHERNIIETYGIETAVAMNEMLSEKWRDLYDVVNPAMEKDYDQHGRWYVSDDGMSDLLNHIVGLGKEVFDMTIEQPELAILCAANNEYRESFGYLFPYDTDEARKYGAEYYIEWANRLLAEELNPDHKSGPDFDEVPAKDIEQVKAAYARFDKICKLVVARKFEEAVEAGDKIYDVVNGLSNLKCAQGANLMWHASLPNLVNDLNCNILRNDNKAGY